MKEWQCDSPGCKYKCIGLGGAIGLRAIGWWFLPGPRLFCPRHRPDPVPCVDKYSDGNHGNSCALCAGEVEAEKIQSRITEILETVS